MASDRTLRRLDGLDQAPADAENFRPRGESLAATVRKLGGGIGGTKYVEVLEEIACAKDEVKLEGPGLPPRVQLAYRYDPELRLRALAMLLDRGWGRPPQEVNLDATFREAEVDLSQLTEDEVLQALALARKAAKGVVH